jgi:hypothetical protein
MTAARDKSIMGKNLAQLAQEREMSPVDAARFVTSVFAADKWVVTSKRGRLSYMHRGKRTLTVAGTMMVRASRPCGEAHGTRRYR